MKTGTRAWDASTFRSLLFSQLPPPRSALRLTKPVHLASMTDEDSDRSGNTTQRQDRHLGDNISVSTYLIYDDHLCEAHEDLQKDLEEVLGSDADFGGDFSFHEKIRSTPNPLLTLKGLGTIGLPLSTREAAVVKANCKQAPFGMGERTVVDHAVRDCHNSPRMRPFPMYRILHSQH